MHGGWVRYPSGRGDKANCAYVSAFNQYGVRLFMAEPVLKEKLEEAVEYLKNESAISTIHVLSVERIKTYTHANGTEVDLDFHREVTHSRVPWNNLKWFTADTKDIVQNCPGVERLEDAVERFEKSQQEQDEENKRIMSELKERNHV